MKSRTALLLMAAALAASLCARQGGGTAGRRTGSPARGEIVVSPGPAGSPVIGPALEAASPGSVIRLRKGVYREIIAITKPVSLIGDEGAVIDPSEPFGARWEPAPEFGHGVYKATVERAPAALFIDGKVFAEVKPYRKETANEGPWFWKRLLAGGTARTGFRYIRGLWLHRREDNAVYLHLEGDANPSAHAWTVTWTARPVISAHDTQDVLIRGVTVAHGFDGIAITDGCRRCSVVRSTVGPWDKNGVMVRNGATGSLIEENDIFRGSYEDLTPVTVAEPGRLLAISRDWYEIWQLHKTAGGSDRVGISITLSGSGNRLHANRIHDVFDGIDLGEGEIESLNYELTDLEHDRGAEIWENVIERTGDSGIEVGGPAKDVRIHHNVLRRTHGGLRYKLPRVGPVFIYRNVLVDGAPNTIWYSMDDSPAEGYVYHNTVAGGDAALHYNGWKTRGIGARNWHYLNNLMITSGGAFFSRDRTIPVNFTWDYNVITGDRRPYPDDPGKDAHSRYVEQVPLEPGFPPRPVPGSAAIDAGLDLSTYFHGKPLPGCEPGYYKGKAPDAGAYEIR